MTIVDLFCGCGGLSLGFQLAGYQILAAYELDAWAAETYANNHAQTRLIQGDLRTVGNWRAALGPKDRGTPLIDGVIGGPPCQGFSLSGARDSSDPRNSLFQEFVRCVRELRPRFCLMENVPGLLSMKLADGQLAIDVIIRQLRYAGYKTCYRVLNAADYGVPQIRQRVFVIGLNTLAKLDPNRLFPQPQIGGDRWVTVDDAISDLPQIQAGEGGDVQNYLHPATTDYQRWARARSTVIRNHVAMRHTARLISRFKVIGHGQSIADVSLEHAARKRGNPAAKSGKVFAHNNSRLHGSRPAPTVAANFQTNFVHPYQHRNFTAREAARLQSFPDDFVFAGKRTTMSWEANLSQYQQIGNAVPPLLAMALATSLKEYIQTLEPSEAPPERGGAYCVCRPGMNALVS
jgi:DNA (cytosine-5)-methyltransferase 1